MSNRKRRPAIDSEKKLIKNRSSVLGNWFKDQTDLEQKPRGYTVVGSDGTFRVQVKKLGEYHLHTTQRQILATQIGEVQGNQHLKHVLSSLKLNGAKNQKPNLTSPRNIVTCSVQGEAERLARTPRTGSWSGLSRVDFNAVAGAIQQGNHRSAIRRIVRTLPISTDNLRRVLLNIVPISLDGDAEPFVPVKDGCSGQSESNHWRYHNQNEIRVLVRINPRVFTEYTLRERVIRLHTTLAHEFTHVEQFVGGGIDSHTRFRREGNREFLAMATPGEADLVGALQEIDAISAEIENMTQTLLPETELIRHAVNYLWENFVSYRREMNRQVDSAIANRVSLNIHRGRQALYTFIDTEPGYRAILRTVRASGGRLTPRSIIESWLYMCPRNYNESWIGGFVTDPTARAEAGNSRSQEARLRANIPAILGRIRRFSG